MIFQDKNDIFDLMDKFDKSLLSELEISTGADFCIRMVKSGGKSTVLEAPRPAENNERDEPVATSLSGKYIKAPLIGTFYSSPSPEAGPYVSPGDKITKGTVVCIIEAMKTMNEIESDTDGEIAEVLVQNAKMVEYGEVLFRLK
ncbi:MAG: acetyl-CoA carboxylase, biotin carboxyl carrier protein [Oscillospiraceae bacterium]|nr:acetyl-CoA carboxylase, biotin carboxyl carrier protein [Oscillospiraceae bacterium]